MTTVVVVKKCGSVAFAADTLVAFGDTRLSHRIEPNSKLFKQDTPAGTSYVGVAGTVAHFSVLGKALAALPSEHLLLGSKAPVLDTFTRLHSVHKKTFFLQTKEDDNDLYESSQISVLIANAAGIFGPYSYTGRCSSSTSSGASARTWGSRSARCMQSGVASRQRANWRASADVPVANSTRIRQEFG